MDLCRRIDNPRLDLAGQDADNALALTWTTGDRNPYGLAFYQSGLFKNWKVSSDRRVASTALIRVAFKENGDADEAKRYDMGNRNRDVAVAKDGSVDVIEDDSPGRLLA